MPDPSIYFVQVKDNETGDEYSVPLERYNASRDLYTKLDVEPVDNVTGASLPIKPRTSVARAVAKKNATTSGQSAAPTKENS